jgi:hypothetical protein
MTRTSRGAIEVRDDFADLPSVLNELTALAKEGDTSPGYVFRGHNNSKYKLMTTWARFRGVPYEGWMPDIDRAIDMFRVGLRRIGINPIEKSDRRAWLEYARHHGVPTPCIDFSLSPYIALFFAVNQFEALNAKEEIASDKKSVAVYALNLSRLADHWVSVLCGVSQGSEDFHKLHKEFLRPSDDWLASEYPANCLQYIPFPDARSVRMQKQFGVFLYDTLDYQQRNAEHLEDMLEKATAPEPALATR